MWYNHAISCTCSKCIAGEKRVKHRLEEKCKELGEQYSVTTIDFEQVVYRDFGNGYDLEISGLWRGRKAKAYIYLWRNKREIVSILRRVPQDCIKEAVARLIDDALHNKFYRREYIREIG